MSEDIKMPNGSTVTIPDEQAKTSQSDPNPSEIPKPSDYQKKLIAQWHESGHTGPAPFASDGKELFWMNRRERRARAKLARTRK